MDLRALLMAHVRHKRIGGALVGHADRLRQPLEKIHHGHGAGPEQPGLHLFGRVRVHRQEQIEGGQFPEFPTSSDVRHVPEQQVLGIREIFLQKLIARMGVD